MAKNLVSQVIIEGIPLVYECAILIMNNRVITNKSIFIEKNCITNVRW
jgi:hypothetical protein